MTHSLSLFLGFLLVGALLILAWDGAHAMASRARLQRLMGMQSKKLDFATGLYRIAAFIPGAADEALHQALVRAGYGASEAPMLFAALRLLGALIMFGAVLASGGIHTRTLLFALLAAFSWRRILSAFLVFKAKSRACALRRELPPAIDVLLMILQSGVSIDQALRHACPMLESVAPLTAAILKRTFADIDSGMPYEQVFARLGQRLGIAEGHDLAALIGQALSQGGEIMTPLERLGAEIAQKRLATAREQMARKSIYLTAVMLGFFMPVLLIALAGPATTSIISTLHVVQQRVHAREAR